MKKLLKSKQRKAIAIILPILLPLFFNILSPQPSSSIQVEAAWHLDGKVKYDRQ